MPGIDQYTKLMLHCDGTDTSTTFTDSSTAQAAKTVTAVDNAQIDTAQQKFGTGSGLFDGAGDYLSVPDSADWDFGSGDFTIDMWARIASSSSHTLVANWSSGAQKSWGFLVQNNQSKLTFFYTTNGSTTVELNGTGLSISTDTWYHFAVTRSGNDLKFWVNGTQQGSTGDVTGVTFHASTDPLLIGALLAGSNEMTGHIDELRISKGIARWNATFTPSSSAYGSTFGMMAFFD